jgi:BASS family bile acid:Na+ symporter
LLGSLLLYLCLSPVNPLIAQSVMVCVLAPTATSAIVITGILGGNISSLASYSLLCNVCVAFFAPVFFAFIGSDAPVSVGRSFWVILWQVFPLLLLPFACSLMLQTFFPAAYAAVRKRQSVSFYLWVAALTVVSARTVEFVLEQGTTGYRTEIAIAAIAMLACILQFYTGRKLGRKYNDTIAGGQGLGQKNTVLAIWMAQTFLNPVSSIGPGAYVLWQNLFNSWQVWRKGRK